MNKKEFFHRKDETKTIALQILTAAFRYLISKHF
ncbi:MAG: hypothetical protein RL708_1119 [Bacteroidota bacterium]|jgi:hypothetical protein